MELRWGGRWGSNPRHPEPQSGVLPLNYSRRTGSDCSIRSAAASASQNRAVSRIVRADGPPRIHVVAVLNTSTVAERHLRFAINSNVLFANSRNQGYKRRI